MKLFVYGSLMRNRWNHHYLEKCIYLGEGVLHDYALYHLITYPAIQSLKGDQVKGEVYEIDEAMLPALDELEEEGVEYKRTRVQVMLEGKKINAYTYVYLLAVDDKKYLPFEKQPWSQVDNE